MKLERLLEGYLEQDIEKEVYRSKKAKLLSEKKSLEEEIFIFQKKAKPLARTDAGMDKRGRKYGKNCIGLQPF